MLLWIKIQVLLYLINKSSQIMPRVTLIINEAK